MTILVVNNKGQYNHRIQRSLQYLKIESELVSNTLTIEEIEAKYGTLICKEMSKQFDDFESKPRMKNCMEIIAYCAKTLVKHAEMER